MNFLFIHVGKAVYQEAQTSKKERTHLPPTLVGGIPYLCQHLTFRVDTFTTVCGTFAGFQSITATSAAGLEEKL